jgi:bla regulator protein BlaR1
VKDYSDTILLDIHRSIGKSPYFDKKKISFILATDSPYYEENKKFVGILLESIRYSSKAELEVLFYDGEILSYFNQDLSKNSLLIEVGSNISSDSDIEECINTLVSALKNVQKVSSK